MGHSLLVVEGAHDAAFFGCLLKADGFSGVKFKRDVPPVWKGLVPNQFPGKDDRLDHVLHFPNFYTRNDESVAIAIAGADNLLTESLRTIYDADDNSISSIGVALDADERTAAKKFDWLRSEFATLNAKSQANDNPGYPLDYPDRPGAFTTRSPKIGVHIFPDNSRAGILEDVLHACSRVSHPEITQQSLKFVDELIENLGHGHSSLNAVKTASGKKKAQTGVVSNILKPGSNIFVAIEKGDWLNGEALDLETVKLARAFLEALIAP